MSTTSGGPKIDKQDELHLLTRREVANLLKISLRTLDRWREERVGPRWIDLSGGSRRKPQIRYRMADIQAFLDDLAV